MLSLPVRFAQRFPTFLQATRVISTSWRHSATPPPLRGHREPCVPLCRYNTVSTGKPVTVTTQIDPSHGTTGMQIPELDKELNYIWLRENCRCEICYNHSTHQKNILPHHVDENIRAIRTQRLRDDLEVSWSDGHSSTYSIRWLQEHYYPAAGQKTKRYLWDSQALNINDVPRVQFNEFVEEDDALEVGINFIHKWISYYFHCKIWEEITYPFLNFIPHFTGYVITYPCWD